MTNDIFQMLGNRVLSYREALDSFDRAVIFGAGGAGQHACRYLQDNNKEVLFFCDNSKNKAGAKLGNVKIMPPESLLNNTDLVVIIASGWSREIALQLKSLGVKRYYDFTDIVYLYQPGGIESDIWGDHFNASLIRESSEQIDKVYESLADDESKHVFSGVLKYRLTMDPSFLEISAYSQYHHPEVRPKINDVIVDAGAWKGDVSIEFARYLKNKCKIYAFEPSVANINDMKLEIVKANVKDAVIPVHMGVWDIEKEFRLNTKAGFDQGFYLDEHGEEAIQLTSLNTFSITNNIDFSLIKMDVEGAEIEALKGASNILSTKHPRLQICVYHKSEDLWEIPLFLQQYYPKGNFYFGHHGQHLHESVLYVGSSLSAHANI